MRDTTTYPRRARALVMLLVAGLAAVLVTPTAARAATGVTFVDLDASPEFATEIAWMGAEGISTGYETSQGREYRPFDTVTRDAMAAFLYRYAGSPEFDAPATPTFSDVTPETSDYYTEIEWVADRDIAGGWSDGTFRPHDAITRDAMATFLFRLAGGTAPGGSAVYVDSSTSPEHKGAIEWLATQGISQGWVNWQGRVYRPFQTITRDAMAAFLYRLEHGAPAVTAHAPVLEEAKDIWTTAATLNLRKSSSWGSSIVVTTKRGAKVHYTGARENGWQQVKVAGYTAWAPSEYLTAHNPGVTFKRVGIRVSELWFRNGPSNGDAVVKKVQQGTRGRLTGVEKGDWSQVSIAGVTGWVPAQHLNIVKEFNASEILTKARSEIGYRSPNWNYNKFNTWAGGTNPWCMVYVMWVFDQIGYPQGVPFQLLYSDWAREAMASGIVDTNVSAADLKPGYVVLVDWPPYEGPTHTGIVDHVNSDGTVVLVEGNTTDGSGDPTRGVFKPTRRIVDMYGVFNPDDYARVHGW